MEKLSAFNKLRLGPAASQKRQRRLSDTAPTAASHSSTPFTWYRSDRQQLTFDNAAQQSVSKASTAADITCAQHKCNAQRCAIVEVFGTTELLELILNFLDTADILRLGRVCCRKWRDLTFSRPRLRRHLFLLPNWSRPPVEFELLGANVEGLTMERGDIVQDGQWIAVSMTRDAACLVLPTGKVRARIRSRSIFEGLRGGLGPRSPESSKSWPSEEPHTLLESGLKLEDVQVARPPVLGMQAFLEETKSDAMSNGGADTESCASLKLHCDGGITLGFLAETVLSLLPEGELSTTQGSSVIFKAIISFTPPRSRRRGYARTVTRLT